MKTSKKNLYLLKTERGKNEGKKKEKSKITDFVGG